MKKILSMLLTVTMSVVLLLSLAPAASAAGGNMTYSFVLSASKTAVKVGDEITVSLVLNRTDTSAEYQLYSMQDEIRYDGTAFELVSDSISLASSSFNAASRSMSDGIHKKIVVSMVDFSGSGATTAGSLEVCTFVLKALTSGNTVIENTDYKVNLPSGLDVYASTANSLSVSVTSSGGTGGNTGDDSGGDTPVSFSDVAEDAWYYDAVQFVVSRGLFEGTGGGKFSPDVSMTRAMLVTVLWRLDGKPASTSQNSFSDVSNGQWYTDAVLWANQNGIVEGYGNGLFGTSDNVTREQMATILYRYAAYKGYDVSASAGLAGFTDSSSVSTWALAAVKWANAEGIITGRTETTLAPSGTANRAEVATILMRFVDCYDA